MSATQPDSKAFRNALGQFPTGVTVITTLDAEGNKVGMTANSFSSVSLDPMLVLWSIAHSSNNLEAFRQTGHWAVHILSSGQEELSGRRGRDGGEEQEHRLARQHQSPASCRMRS